MKDTDTPTKSMTLVQALNDFFSPPKISVAEMKKLDADDRLYFKALLEGIGYTIIAAGI